MLLRDYFKLGDLDSEFIRNGADISGQDLIDILPALQQCEEFKNCKLHTTDLPAVYINGSHRFVASTMHSDRVRYTGHGWIRDITLSPLMYDPNDFSPKRSIIIRGLFNVTDYEESITSSDSVYQEWTDKWTFKL